MCQNDGSLLAHSHIYRIYIDFDIPWVFVHAKLLNESMRLWIVCICECRFRRILYILFAFSFFQWYIFAYISVSLISDIWSFSLFSFSLRKITESFNFIWFKLRNVILHSIFVSNWESPINVYWSINFSAKRKFKDNPYNRS